MCPIWWVYEIWCPILFLGVIKNNWNPSGVLQTIWVNLIRKLFFSSTMSERDVQLQPQFCVLLIKEWTTTDGTERVLKSDADYFDSLVPRLGGYLDYFDIPLPPQDETRVMIDRLRVSDLGKFWVYVCSCLAEGARAAGAGAQAISALVMNFATA
ncbi:hypothetical protein CFOL_v3_12321 [Cephalotus follicularis]|uniref:Uncharacterized protein n=1 Tax=Cephalotus follicularis TaxID=3775 RepID=A0A1Q3BLM3_CEPFO|nr:hypothetical protein CFOL_v3_12321 [Cephalotus follicularis]